jgi:cellulose 1,4-beta-cellobiosidase
LTFVRLQRVAQFKMYGKIATLASLFAAATAQQVGTLTTETHPSLSYSTCSSGGSCTTVNGQVTIDANWRWLHQTSGSTNCYTGNTWNTTICSSATTCASSCALDGADYSGTYGVSTSGNALTLGFVTKGPYCEL